MIDKVANKLTAFKVDRPLRPCPMEQPMATTAPTPMQAPPHIWRDMSALLVKPSHLKLPFMRALMPAPTATPKTETKPTVQRLLPSLK